jgi:hypothetical protein
MLLQQSKCPSSIFGGWDDLTVHLFQGMSKYRLEARWASEGMPGYRQTARLESHRLGLIAGSAESLLLFFEVKYARSFSIYFQA